MGAGHGRHGYGRGRSQGLARVEADVARPVAVDGVDVQLERPPGRVRPLARGTDILGAAGPVQVAHVLPDLADHPAAVRAPEPAVGQRPSALSYEGGQRA